MPITYIKIASAEVGAGGAANIDFTSIPQTYTDLMVVTSLRSTAGGGPESYFAYAAFNGVTTNRRYLRLEATGTSVSTDSGTLAPVSVTGGTGGTANTFNNGTFYIHNYSSSSMYKTYSANWASENNSSTTSDLGFIAGAWLANTAINQITLTVSTGNLAQYSTAYLYGIKKD